VSRRFHRALFALTLLATLLGWAGSATASPAVALSIKAPIAVRAGATFTAKGAAGPAAAPGETVTVLLARRTGGWSTVASASVVLSSSRTFSAKFKADKRGLWRVSASLPATMTHAAASASQQLRAFGKKVLALTFDDGPWPTTTAKIVAELHDADVRATFFELGSQVGPRAKLSKLVAENGNLIGVHSWNHAIMTRRTSAVNKADLRRCIKAVQRATGITPHWFRPPYGSTNSRLRSTAESLGLRQVLWSVDTLDWKYRTVSSVVSRTMRGARDGSIVLMHDGGGPRAATAAAVPIVIKRLRAKGFDFATLDELVALGYRVR
jgi:peptidoglycan/xylan/chitin deacetylase (PgdA/CDA1 family)